MCRGCESRTRLLRGARCAIDEGLALMRANKFRQATDRLQRAAIDFAGPTLNPNWQPRPYLPHEHPLRAAKPGQQLSLAL